MKLCINCLRELFDHDKICDKCGSSNILSSPEIESIRKDILFCNKIKLNKLLKNENYNAVYHYIQKKDKDTLVVPQIIRQNNVNINPSPRPSTPTTNAKPTVTCPYCQSTNTKKITGLSKVGSAALWGVFAAGKVSKQWHCNNCKSDF